MQCPAIVSGVTNRVESLWPLRAGFTPSNFGSPFPSQTNFIPRKSRDFYFAFREIEPASRIARTRHHHADQE